MKNFYKVYETIDNVPETMENYPTYFVGAFVDEKMAKSLCVNIDIANCNTTKIKFGIITQKDVDDLKIYGLKGCDKAALEQISLFLKSKYQEIER